MIKFILDYANWHEGLENKICDDKKYNKKIELQDIEDYDIIKGYIDTFILMNFMNKQEEDNFKYRNLGVYQNDKLVGIAEIKYNTDIRQFVN